MVHSDFCNIHIPPHFSQEKAYPPYGVTHELSWCGLSALRILPSMSLSHGPCTWAACSKGMSLNIWFFRRRYSSFPICKYLFIKLHLPPKIHMSERQSPHPIIGIKQTLAFPVSMAAKMSTRNLGSSKERLDFEFEASDASRTSSLIVLAFL